MLIGAFGVIAYKDIKKIAAYQVILSIGFIILGLGSHTHAGVNGAIFYLSNDIIVKTLLFFIIGSLVYISGFRNYQYLSGLAKGTLLWCCIYCDGICNRWCTSV